MLKQLTNVSVWVHDQDEALGFYTDKLGMELREDVTVPEMGNFRWLTVGVPGQQDVNIALLAVPGPPVFDAETQEQVKALVAKGAAGGLFFSTENCRATYEELSERGIIFDSPIEEGPFSRVTSFADPDGNTFVLHQLYQPRVRPVSFAPAGS